MHSLGHRGSVVWSRGHRSNLGVGPVGCCLHALDLRQALIHPSPDDETQVEAEVRDGQDRRGQTQMQLLYLIPLTSWGACRHTLCTLAVCKPGWLACVRACVHVWLSGEQGKEKTEPHGRCRRPAAEQEVDINLSICVRIGPPSGSNPYRIYPVHMYIHTCIRGWDGNDRKGCINGRNSGLVEIGLASGRRRRQDRWQARRHFRPPRPRAEGSQKGVRTLPAKQPQHAAISTASQLATQPAGCVSS